MHPSAFPSAAAASSSTSYATPSPKETLINKQPLGMEHLFRLVSFLKTRYTTELTHSPTPLVALLNQFITYVHEMPYGANVITEMTLKGSVINHILLGDHIPFADIDIEFEINPHVNLKEFGRNLLKSIPEKFGQLQGYKLINDPNNQFLILTLGTHPKKIDLLFSLQSMHKCTCSYNSLRIDILSLVHYLVSVEYDKSLICPPVIIKTVDYYDLQEAFKDINERRFSVRNAHSIYEGLRTYCAMITKGILPKYIADENDFCFGFVKQYAPNYTPHPFLHLEKNMMHFLPRHYEEDLKSKIVYLLNYEDIIRRSNIEIKQKEIVQIDITRLITQHLGHLWSRIQRDTQQKAEDEHQNAIQFLNCCRYYFFLRFSKVKTVPYSFGEMTIYSTCVDELKNLHLISQEVTQINLELFIRNLPETINDNPLLRRFSHLFLHDSTDILTFFRSFLVERAPLEPLIVPEEEEEEKLLSELPQSLSASSIKPAMSPTDQLFSEINDLIDGPLQEVLNKVFRLLDFKVFNSKKIKTLGEILNRLISKLLEEKQINQALQLYMISLRQLGCDCVEASSPIDLIPCMSSLMNALKSEKSIDVKSVMLILELYKSLIHFKIEMPLERRSKLLNFLSSHLEILIGGLPLNKKKKGITHVIQILSLARKVTALPPRNILKESLIVVMIQQDSIDKSIEILWEIHAIHTDPATNKEIKECIELFIQSILSISKPICLMYYSKLYQTFSIVGENKRSIFDPLFTLQIQKIGAELYLTFQNELKEQHLSRFIPYFQAFVSSLLIYDFDEKSESVLFQGVDRIIQESATPEIALETIKHVCPPKMLMKYPNVIAHCESFDKKITTPTSAKDYIKKANSYLSNQFNMAIELLSEAYEKYPDHIEILIELGDVWSKSSQHSFNVGNYVLCSTQLNSAIRFNEDAFTAFNTLLEAGGSGELISTCNKKLGKLAESLKKNYSNLGLTYSKINSKDAFKEVLQFIKSIRELHPISSPGNDSSHFFYTFFSTKDLTSSKLTRNEKERECAILTNLAAAYADLDQLKESAKFYEKAYIQQNMLTTPVIYQISTVYHKLKSWEKALYYYRMLVKRVKEKDELERLNKIVSELNQIIRVEQNKSFMNSFKRLIATYDHHYLVTFTPGFYAENILMLFTNEALERDQYNALGRIVQAVGKELLDQDKIELAYELILETLKKISWKPLVDEANPKQSIALRLLITLTNNETPLSLNQRRAKTLRSLLESMGSSLPRYKDKSTVTQRASNSSVDYENPREFEESADVIGGIFNQSTSHTAATSNSRRFALFGFSQITTLPLIAWNILTSRCRSKKSKV